MADVVNIIVAQATENVKENATNATGKPPSTPEGMAVAYGSIVIMALLPIFFGAYRSVNYHKENVRQPVTE
jgi:minor histocompatibility antigen H13